MFTARCSLEVDLVQVNWKKNKIEFNAPQTSDSGINASYMAFK